MEYQRKALEKQAKVNTTTVKKKILFTDPSSHLYGHVADKGFFSKRKVICAGKATFFPFPMQPENIMVTALRIINCGHSYCTRKEWTKYFTPTAVTAPSYLAHTAMSHQLMITRIMTIVFHR